MKLKNNLTFDNLIAHYESLYNCHYDNLQVNELRLGYENGVDIGKYTNPSFEWIYMTHLRRALEHGSDISRYVKPTYVPQLLKVISDLAVFNVDIEEFVSDNQLDIGGMLDLHSHLLRSKNIDPLDDILQEALCMLGPYYVNE